MAPSKKDFEKSILSKKNQFHYLKNNLINKKN